MGMPGGYSNSGERQDLLRRFQIDRQLMAKASDNAVFMHCLPVYRGQEATAEVVDGPQSVIWQEAENRLHVQKAIMAWLMGTMKSGQVRNHDGRTGFVSVQRHLAVSY